MRAKSIESLSAREVTLGERRGDEERRMKRARGKRPLCGAGVLGDDDAILVILDVSLNVYGDSGLGKEAVDGDLEEALELGGVEVHGHDVVHSRDMEHVCDELGGDGAPGLLLALLGVREEGDDRRDTLGRGHLAGADEDDELHEGIVGLDIPGPTLDDVDILPAHGLRERQAQLPVPILLPVSVNQRDSQPLTHLLRQVRVARTRDHLRMAHLFLLCPAWK